MCCNAKNQFSNQRLRTANILTEVLNTKNRMQSHIRNLWIICILVIICNRQTSCNLWIIRNLSRLVSGRSGNVLALGRSAWTPAKALVVD